MADEQRFYTFKELKDAAKDNPAIATFLAKDGNESDIKTQMEISGSYVKISKDDTKDGTPELFFLNGEPNNFGKETGNEKKRDEAYIRRLEDICIASPGSNFKNLADALKNLHTLEDAAKKDPNQKGGAEIARAGFAAQHSDDLEDFARSLPENELIKKVKNLIVKDADTPLDVEQTLVAAGAYAKAINQGGDEEAAKEALRFALEQYHLAHAATGNEAATPPASAQATPTRPKDLSWLLYRTNMGTDSDRLVTEDGKSLEGFNKENEGVLKNTLEGIIRQRLGLGVGSDAPDPISEFQKKLGIELTDETKNGFVRAVKAYSWAVQYPDDASDDAQAIQIARYAGGFMREGDPKEGDTLKAIERIKKLYEKQKNPGASAAVKAASPPDASEQEKPVEPLIPVPDDRVSDSGVIDYLNENLGAIGKALGKSESESGKEVLQAFQLAIHEALKNDPKTSVRLEHKGVMTPMTMIAVKAYRDSSLHGKTGNARELHEAGIKAAKEAVEKASEKARAKDPAKDASAAPPKESPAKKPAEPKQEVVAAQAEGKGSKTYFVSSILAGLNALLHGGKDAVITVDTKEKPSAIVAVEQEAPQPKNFVEIMQRNAIAPLNSYDCRDHSIASLGNVTLNTHLTQTKPLQIQEAGMMPRGGVCDMA
jgi:hypothetical protein